MKKDVINKTLGSVVAPHISEKAAILADRGVFTFEVSPRATKKDIAQLIKDTYKVTPVSVNIAKTPKKPITRAGFAGRKGGMKKAYVTLKKGDTISFI